MASKRFDIAVIGLGYVGLPLALEASSVGLRVLGFDIDPQRVAALRRGDSHVDDVGSEELQAALSDGLFVTSDEAELRRAQAFSICVPTPLRDQVPDLAAVRSAAEIVGRNLEGGELVVLESTTYPGTTEEVVQPIIEEHSGLKAGDGFRLAYSPERIDPGNETWNLRNTPKIVGGIDGKSTDDAAALYGKVCLEVVVVSNPRIAEMAKLLENTYRHVNIALVNELAIYCRDMGIDIREAIGAAATKPFGFQPFYPGPGVGGHCIPIDPSYLSYRVRQLGHTFRFVELAQDINGSMPRYVMSRVADLLNGIGKPLVGSRVLLLGVAYKPDIGDTRESPARTVAGLLADRGADVRYCDPLVDGFSVDGTTLGRLDDPLEAAGWADILLVMTPHSSFDLPAICEQASLVLDTRGVVPAQLAHYL